MNRAERRRKARESKRPTNDGTWNTTCIRLEPFDGHWAVMYHRHALQFVAPDDAWCSRQPGRQLLEEFDQGDGPCVVCGSRDGPSYRTVRDGATGEATCSDCTMTLAGMILGVGFRLVPVDGKRS